MLFTVSHAFVSLAQPPINPPFCLPTSSVTDAQLGEVLLMGSTVSCGACALHRGRSWFQGSGGTLRCRSSQGARRKNRRGGRHRRSSPTPGWAADVDEPHDPPRCQALVTEARWFVQGSTQPFTVPVPFKLATENNNRAARAAKVKEESEAAQVAECTFSPATNHRAQRELIEAILSDNSNIHGEFSSYIDY